MYLSLKSLTFFFRIVTALALLVLFGLVFGVAMANPQVG